MAIYTEISLHTSTNISVSRGADDAQEMMQSGWRKREMKLYKFLPFVPLSIFYIIPQYEFSINRLGFFMISLPNAK